MRRIKRNSALRAKDVHAQLQFLRHICGDRLRRPLQHNVDVAGPSHEREFLPGQLPGLVGRDLGVEVEALNPRLANVVQAV